MNSIKSINLLMIIASCLFIYSQAYSACPGNLGASELTTQAKRFVLRDDGTISDMQSGLMWKICLQGLSGDNCTSGIVSELSWVDALNEARSEEFAGFDNWRLPKLAEFESIVDLCFSNPAVDQAVFPNQIAGKVWTASANIDYATDAWSIDFSDGKPVVIGRHKAMMVRLTRNMP